MRVSQRLQVTLAALCVVGFAGFLATFIAAAWGHYAVDRMAGEMERLHGTAHLEAERARNAFEQAIAERAQAAVERDSALAERDRALGERDAALIANRHVLFQLGARTQSTIAKVEGIIASTGLDPDRLVKAQARKVPAIGPRGGPFVPWREQIAPSTGLDRLQALRDGLAHLPLASPVARVELSDGFGFRIDPFTGHPALHEGIDLRGDGDAAVHATAAGIVSYAGWKSQYGNLVEIDHGFGLTTRYAHLRAIAVKVGEAVALHQQLGLIGATGRATAAHLHYEIRVDGQARNPLNFLKVNRHVPETSRPVPEEVPTAAYQFSNVDNR